MSLRQIALLLVLTTLATTADAQRRRPARDGGGGQTPKTVQESIRSAEEKEAARTAELRTGWKDAKESHYKKQDKATRMRMRQNAGGENEQPKADRFLGGHAFSGSQIVTDSNRFNRRIRPIEKKSEVSSFVGARLSVALKKFKSSV